MNCHSSRLLLIPLVCALMAQHCCSFPEPQLKRTLEQLALPRVTCYVRRIKAVFGPMVKSNIHVKDITGATIPVPRSKESCGVRLTRDKNRNLSFFSRYDSCYAQIEGSKVAIPLQVQVTGEDHWVRVKISCPLIKRHSNRTRLIPAPLPGNCDIEQVLRVECGPQGISSEACYKMGCCYDAHDSTCYYRLNACSLDGHFVFSVKATDTDLPIDPSNLIIKDHPHCFPVITTQDTAVFKFGVLDCGTKMKVDGDVMIYEVDVEEQHKRTTRNSPFSLQVQCEYGASDIERVAELRSLYAVTHPPPVVAQGAIKVLMRIAKDASFTSFFPEDQLPLSLPLRKAAYVEISIAQPSPDPALSLRVQDCFAYPSSRHSVWMLLYDGCPNPLDNMRSSIPVDKQGRTTSHSQTRRFDVKTFAFVDPHSGHPTVDEIYFYCWVEICTNDADCTQQCTIISSEGERQRRAVTSEPEQVQLVSLGPLLLGRNGTQVEDAPCVKQKTLFPVAVYMLSGMGASLLLIVIFPAWMTFRRRRKPEAQQVCDAQDGTEQSQ